MSDSIVDEDIESLLTTHVVPKLHSTELVMADPKDKSKMQLLIKYKIKEDALSVHDYTTKNEMSSNTGHTSITGPIKEVCQNRKPFQTRLRNAMSLSKKTNQNPDFNFYKCIFCPYRTTVVANINSHLGGHYTKRSFTCKVSIETATSQSSKPHKCQSCAFETHSFVILCEHISYRHTSTYKCSRCPLTVRTVSKMKTHLLRKHLTGFETCFMCGRCGFGTNLRSALKNHIVCKHEPHYMGTWLKFEKCAFTVTSSMTLRNSIRQTNPKLFQHLLSIGCGDRVEPEHPKTVKIDSIVQSKESRNEAGSLLKCPFCQFTVKSESVLKSHEMMRHIRRIHSPGHEWFKCEHCRFKSMDAMVVIIHMANKHWKKEMKEQWFQCAHCAFQAMDKTVMTSHMGSKHLLKGQFQCTHYPFKAKEEMVVKNHTGMQHRLQILSFQCGKCSFRSTAGVLNAHYLSEHINGTDK